MMNIKIASVFLAISFYATPAILNAAPPGRPFDDLQQQINALSTANSALVSRVSLLEAELGLANAKIAVIESNSALDLDGLVTVDDSGSYTTVMMTGVNLQVVNGDGITDSVNGVGNIIVGYNAPGFFLETDPDGNLKFCSDGQYNNQVDCEMNGGVWANSHKSGSHNVIIGDNHNYSQYAGLVVGANNAIRAPNSAVSGGHRNQVTAEHASISGGRDNYATAVFATVAGGFDNQANANFAHVSGGEDNRASGIFSSILGGQGERALVSWETIPVLP